MRDCVAPVSSQDVPEKYDGAGRLPSALMASNL